MQRPVTDVVELKEPDATSVVYVQGDHGWRMFPADAPTLKRTIRLEPVPYDPNWPGAYPQTSVMVELSTGAWPRFMNRGLHVPEVEYVAFPEGSTALN
jgi:hypothetical protein